MARHLPAELSLSQTQAVRIAATDRLYIPDLVVLPEAAMADPGTEVAADEALLVVEITSSRRNADTDRAFTRRGYAHGPVPLYLLVDRWAKPRASVTLFSEPRDGDYTRDVRVPFGEKITLPAPFGLDVDPAGFPPGQ
ncbi:MAG TPA: Uma2 family endonuclease [Actinocatenispora sp.]